MQYSTVLQGREGGREGGNPTVVQYSTVLQGREGGREPYRSAV